MSNSLRKVDYFHVMIPNRAGQASKIAAALAAAGVNLLAFSGFPSGKLTQLDLMPEDSAKLKRAAKINLIAVDAVTAGKGRFGAIFWVKREAVVKTAKVLGAK